MAATLLITGCGGGDTNDALAPAPASAGSPPKPKLTLDQLTLNATLMLGYVGAQYHAMAATGRGLPAELTGNAGQAAAPGGRAVAFESDAVSSIATQLAQGKAQQLVTLRQGLGDAAAGQPAIDLGGSAFGEAAQRSGIVPTGTGFDPFADQGSYLLGALFLEHEVAAAYRSAAASLTDSVSAEMAYSLLPGAIYHDAALRSTIAALASDDPTLLTKAQAVGRYMSQVVDAGATAPLEASEARDMLDLPIPVLRTPSSAVRTLFLGQPSAGGFLPQGVGGVMA